MIPTCKVGHVFAELLRATVSVGVESDILAGFGEFFEIGVGEVSGMSNAVGEEGSSFGREEPITTFDFRKAEVVGPLPFFGFGGLRLNCPRSRMAKAKAKSPNGQFDRLRFIYWFF